MAQPRDQAKERLLEPLLRRGIPVTDEDKLISVMEGDDPGLATSAAYALQFLGKTQKVVDALTIAIRSRRPNVPKYAENAWDLQAVYAARSLRQLGDRGWVSVAKERLKQIAQINTRIQMGAVLAGEGVYDAWPLVRDNLTENSYGYQALIALPAFVGMKGPDGIDVDIAAELSRVMPLLPADRRAVAGAILTEINRKRQFK
jgi:hypothetical protein